MGQAIEALGQDLETLVSYGFSRTIVPICKISRLFSSSPSSGVGIELRACTRQASVLAPSHHLGPLLKQSLSEVPGCS